MENDQNLPGKEGIRFKVVLRSIDFGTHTMLDREFQVTSKSNVKYDKWYWKILNKLTFGLFFNKKYYYTIEEISDGKDNPI